MIKEPPYAEPHVRWCERSENDSRRETTYVIFLLLDYIEAVLYIYGMVSRRGGKGTCVFLDLRAIFFPSSFIAQKKEGLSNRQTHIYNYIGKVINI